MENNKTLVRSSLNAVKPKNQQENVESSTIWYPVKTVKTKPIIANYSEIRSDSSSQQSQKMMKPEVKVGGNKNKKKSSVLEEVESVLQLLAGLPVQALPHQEG